MSIEFYTPQSEVPEHVIYFLKEKLMDFYHRDNEIDDADVVLRHQHLPGANEFVCEVTLNLYGESLMVHRSGNTYMEAAKDVVDEIALKIGDFFKRRNDLPELITSTVKV